jgi:hypothetical protein
MPAPSGLPAPPPHLQLIQMATGFWVSRLIWVAADLALADKLAAGPRSAADVARETGSHPRALHRLMRALASLGLLTEGVDERFALTPLGAALKTGAPGAAREYTLCMGGSWAWRAWQEFPHSVQTGGTAMEKAHGIGVFDYLAQHPQDASNFSKAMVAIHGDEAAAVAEACDFSGFGTIVDVGGATGQLISTVLARHKGPRGILFDLPHVVRDAPALVAPRGLGDRLAIEAGSMFERAPAGADAYLLSHVIHDWPEDKCLAILGNVRRAMKPSSKLLIVEFVLPAGSEPHFGKLLDMVMLALPGGEERTTKEYGELLGKAGFRLVRVVPTTTQVSVVEAVLA